MSLISAESNRGVSTDNATLSTKDLETKVRELQREMVKKKIEAEKLRKALELKEKEVLFFSFNFF